MTKAAEREVRLQDEADVLCAARSGLALARGSGLDLERQFRLCAFIAEASKRALSGGGRGAVIVRDESDAARARVSVTVRSSDTPQLWRGCGGWRTKWELADFDVRDDPPQSFLSAAVQQPRRGHGQDSEARR